MRRTPRPMMMLKTWKRNDKSRPRAGRYPRSIQPIEDFTINKDASPCGPLVKPLAMEFDEANRISAQFEAGRLNPELPGTMDLVNEARRVQVQNRLSGTTGLNRRQRTSRRYVLAACCLTIVITLVLALPSLTMR